MDRQHPIILTIQISPVETQITLLCFPVAHTPNLAVNDNYKMAAALTCCRIASILYKLEEEPVICFIYIGGF